MPESTDAEKLERRRRRRQQKILQSAGDRLSKITGSQYPTHSSPTPSPSVSLSKESHRSRSPSPAVFGTPSSSTDTSNLHHAIDNVMADAIPNPLQQLLGESNIHSTLFNMTQQAQEHTQPMMTSRSDSREKYWQYLHLILMFWLGIYTVYYEWTRLGTERFASLLYSDPSTSSFPSIHVPLFWYFVTLELCLHSTRIFFQRGAISSQSTLGALAAQLPPPFGNTITVILRYHLIWTSLIQDGCILVFIIGIAQVLSAIRG